MNFNPNLCCNESEVESRLIVQCLLPALGYSQRDWYQEVALENIRLDFLAFATQILPFRLDDSSALSLVIEAKSPQNKLDPFIRRLQQYLAALHTDFDLLNNGKELRIYQRHGERIQQLIFRCAGEGIGKKIEEIKAIAGKEAIKERKRRNEISVNLRQQQQEQRPMRIIAIYHNKGGVGKTTVSVNLAAALRRKGFNVLLIDLDSQANSTFATGLVKFQFEEDDTLRDKNVYHLLESGDFDFIQDISRKSDLFNTPEIDVVPAHISLIEGQYKLNQNAPSQTRLIKKLMREEGNYDLVIIDTPPSRDIYARVAIIAAHYLIIPSDLKPFANQGLKSVRSFVQEINEFREAMNRPLINVIGVLPSKISTNPAFIEKAFVRQKQSVKDRYSLAVMDSIIHERVALSHCINKTMLFGELELPDPKSIFDFAETNASASKSADEFEALAVEVLNYMEDR